MEISVIIPAYNEEKILGKVLDDIKGLAGERGYDAQIIVVDDGSKDGTADVARSKGAVIVRHKKNRGYGASLKSGITVAKNEIVLMMDGDGSYPVEEIPDLLDKIEGLDMVIGARVKKGVRMSLLRRIPKFILGKLAEYLVKERIPDINSGMRVFRLPMYERHKGILPDTFSFTLTITLAAISGGERIEFVPINYYKRKGFSKIRPIHDTLNFLLLIVRTILFFNPVRVFVPIAAAFILAAAAMAVYSITVIGRFLDVTVTLLFVSGVQLLILGLIADLIDRKLKR